jgi:hypothetical protein
MRGIWTDPDYSPTPVVSKTPTNIATGTLFNFQGSIQILGIKARITTAIQAQATTVKLQYQSDALAVVDICASLDINGFGIGSMLALTGKFTDALVGTTLVGGVSGGFIPLDLTCTTSGIIKLVAGATSTGVAKWDILWLPTDAAGLLTAA